MEQAYIQANKNYIDEKIRKVQENCTPKQTSQKRKLKSCISNGPYLAKTSVISERLMWQNVAFVEINDD